MHLDPTLSVLLVVTSSVQLGALATRIARRKLSALAMAGANAALALALTLLIFGRPLVNGRKLDAAPAVFGVGALALAAAVAAAIGLVKRSESGWLFWPVWLWNFVMVYALVYMKFFFRLVF